MKAEVIQPSYDDWNKWYPERSIKEGFLQQKHIASLPPAEQEARWKEHYEGVKEIFSFLAGTDTFVITP